MSKPHQTIIVLPEMTYRNVNLGWLNLLEGKDE
jgi:hypothetical protein